MAIVPGIGGLGLGGIQPPTIGPAEPGASSVPGLPSGIGNAEAFGLHFSKHATKRLEQRGRALDATRTERLDRAAGQGAEQGTKATLILLNEQAPVGVTKNRTIVTA